MDITPILDGLNEAQREAVTSDAKHLLVLAGAGSGKTRVLVHRMAWMIDVMGLSPHGILAVTFTNKAAREMRGRIETMLGINTRAMWVGTFHGIANRLLTQHWQEAGLPQHFQILDSDDQLRVIKRLVSALGLDEKRWPARQAQWFINEQKDEGLRAAHIDPGHDPFIQTQLKIYTAYEETCKQSGFVDFGELLLKSHELWLKKPDLLAHYQGRFHSILVDEFQDTNSIQYAWLRVLAGDKRSVVVVGDDDQSIYGWRGARIENIQNFEKDFGAQNEGGVHTVRLEQNYRSTGTILKAANAVIARNSGRLGKNLWTEAEDGEQISLYAGFNETDEARFIAEYLNRWVDRGNLRKDSAILYRSNAQSRVLEDSLLRLGIPYRIYGGQRFYERLEIRNALAYLRLTVNRGDDAAFERVINTPTRGIGAKTLEHIRNLAREDQSSLWAASLKMIESKVLPARASNAVDSFLQLINELSESFKDIELAEMVDQVLDMTGLLEFHKAEKGERGQTRVENLHELVSACKAYSPADGASYVEDATPEGKQEAEQNLLVQFLADAALDAGDTQADEHEDAVQLMTLHSAKGLEFPLVLLAGMEENLFPHSMSADDPVRLEEERRLAYVGITRAMEKLVLTYAECRRMHGDERYNSVSRFVRDLPSELVEEVRVSTGFSGRSAAPKPILTANLQQEDIGFKLGQQVLHPKFGEGTILNIEGNEPRTIVTVNFETEGTKMLILSQAPLQAL